MQNAYNFNIMTNLISLKYLYQPFDTSLHSPNVQVYISKTKNIIMTLLKKHTWGRNNININNKNIINNNNNNNNSDINNNKIIRIKLNNTNKIK